MAEWLILENDFCNECVFLYKIKVYGLGYSKEIMHRFG